MKIKVLFISSFSSMHGGGQISTYLLMKHLSSNDFETSLLLHEEGNFAGLVRNLKKKVFIAELPRLRSLNIIKTISAFVEFVKIIKENRINIVHVESPRETIYAGLLRLFTSARVVSHLRVSDGNIFYDFLLSFFADRFIAVSESVKDRFRKISRADKVDVVYNAVDLKEFTNQESSVNSGNSLRLGYFGRLHPRKGLETLIEAVNDIDEKVQLMIVGDGEPDYLQSLISIADREKVRFKDYTDNILAEMKSVDVLVMPAVLNEGLSRMIVEGMALSKIVIVSDVPSNVEALGADLSQYVYPAGDTAALKDLLKTLFVNDDKKRVADLFRHRAEECFDVCKNTIEIEQIYRTLLNLR